jgi:hypothetical protein
MSSLENLFAAAETVRELPMPPIVFGLLAFTGFMILLGVLWFFRGVGHKIAVGGTAHTTHAPQGDHQGSHH